MIGREKRLNLSLVVGAGVVSTAGLAVMPGQAVDVPADGKLTISVDGRLVDVFSNPGMPSTLSLRRRIALDVVDAAADRERFSSRLRILSFGGNPNSRIGTTLIRGYLSTAVVSLGLHVKKSTVKWSLTDAYDFADGLAGPYAIPSSIIRYQLRKATGTERRLSLRLLPATAWWVASTDRQIGGKQILFAFAPHFAETVASAAAAEAISSEFGGELDGVTRSVVISHNVQRPVKPMRLLRPVILGSVRIRRLLVRVADYGTVGSIPDATIDPSESGGDVVVTGRRIRSRPSHLDYLGADALQNCSSITFDKTRHMIDLDCVPQAGL